MMGLDDAALGGTWLRRRSRSGMSEINITAFVDVLLVLLIIFMMTSQFLRAGFDVNLPKADTPGLPEQTDPLIVTLGTDRSIAVGDVRLQAPEQLQAVIEGEIGATSQRPVYLKADKDVPYGAIIGLMSVIRKAGVRDVGLMTEAGQEEWFGQ